MSAIAIDRYPVNSRSISTDHQGGTKSYHFLLIQSAAGPSIVVFRWGRKGQFGEVDVKLFADHASAEKAFDAKFKDKTRKGYRPTGPAKIDSAEDLAGLKKLIGPALWVKIGKEGLLHLDPAIDVTGMRIADRPQFDENGVKQDVARKADISEDIEAQKRSIAERDRAVLSSNPDFGAF